MIFNMLDKKDNNVVNNCMGGCGCNKSDSFVDSIEEEIRNENWQRLWDKYGKFITYASCAVIAAVGVYGFWKKQEIAEREAISARYTLVQSAISSGDPESALSQFKELANVSKKDYATLSKFEYAALLRYKNDKQALKEYQRIFEDKSANNILKDLAYIFYVNAALDLMPTKELMTKLDEFTSNLEKSYIGKTWDLFAKESLAFCYIKKGDNEQAKKALMQLAKTPGITEAMLDRAKTLLHSLEA